MTLNVKQLFLVLLVDYLLFDSVDRLFVCYVAGNLFGWLCDW